MESTIRVLRIDATNGFYKIERFKVGDFFGPVDLGISLSRRYNSLNIGTGLLAGSIFPGSNRLIFTGHSPAWQGFYISTMGGASLVFDNLGINMISITGKAPQPSMLYLNRIHEEEIEVELKILDVNRIWNEGRKGVYALMDHTLEHYLDKYLTPPRVLAVGKSALTTDFGGICSAPVKQGKNSYVDTWAGRGGFGSKMLQEHGIASVIYGGTYIDEDFTDRKVANEWFENKYQKKMAAKDVEATTKYRYDPNFNTGGTLGVNYHKLQGELLSFNYKSIYWTEEKRLEVNDRLITNHYLQQFNQETIAKKQQFNCGEPCAAVCKKMNGEYKKDYEPYQTMGPLIGIFDQRAAEKVNHHADMYGFDAISVGGVLAWLFECMDEDLIKPEEVGASEKPVFTPDNFDAVKDSMHNANIACDILDAIVEQKGILNFEEGARKLARKLSRERGKAIINKFVFNSFARKGWMVPNQYWTPGVLSPMSIMGKYFMYYGSEFVAPRELGEINADRFNKELILDNLGFCRFHRAWAEEMLPEIVETLWGKKDEFLKKLEMTTTRANSRNASVFWESERNIDFIWYFMKRKKEVDQNKSEKFDYWFNLFEKDKYKAAEEYWYEVHKGIHLTLREF